MSSCDSAVLWRYLTALHDRRRVVDWINWHQETSSAPRWPDLTPELVNNNTACSTYMRENILDLLARYSSAVHHMTLWSLTVLPLLQKLLIFKHPVFILRKNLK